FPSGLGTFTAPSNTFLSFEQGPSQTVQLQWASYFDASDQAGISRLYGGIHVSSDDLTGRGVGSGGGKVFLGLAQKYYDGSIAAPPTADTSFAAPRTMLTIQQLDATTHRVQFNTVRGLYYLLQSTPSLTEPFTNEAAFSQAFDSVISLTNTTKG